MSVLIAIFQAIGQALSFILPISELGHSAIFHNLSGRFTNACSQLTGVIHIGIALGIIIAFYKLFISLLKNFFATWIDIFKKRLDLKNISRSREFMFMTILSFAFLILYVIPAGQYGNLYMIFKRTSFNTNLLGEGVCFLLTGLMIFLVFSIVGKKTPQIPSFLKAVILGLITFLAIPTAGCSLVAGILCIGMLLGMTEKYALRYAVVISTPVLLTMGIVQLCVAVTKVNIVPALIALVISAGVTFIAVKLLIIIIKKKQIKLFAIYDIAIGLICAVIGIFQIVLK